MFSNRTQVDFAYDPKRICSPGYTIQILDSYKKCKDRYSLADDGTITIPELKRNYSKMDFCIEINGNATNKDQHGAQICVANEEVKDKDLS